MNDAIQSLVIGLTVIIIFSIPFIFFGYIRYLRYKETITLAERGLLQPSRSEGHNGNGKNLLRWGIVIAFLGAAVTCGLIPFGFFLASPRSGTAEAVQYGFGPWLIIGFLPLFFGLALLVIYYITRRNRAYEVADPEPTHEGESDSIPPHKL